MMATPRDNEDSELDDHHTATSIDSFDSQVLLID